MDGGVLQVSRRLDGYGNRMQRDHDQDAELTTAAPEGAGPDTHARTRLSQVGVLDDPSDTGRVSGASVHHPAEFG